MKLFVGISEKLQQQERERKIDTRDLDGYLPHLEEDLSYLCSHLHQWMKMTACRRGAHSVKIIQLKLLSTPRPSKTNTKIVKPDSKLYSPL